MDYKEVYEQLESVKEIIININRSSEEFLNESIDYLVASGGKMLRPAFIILGSQFGDLEQKDDKKIRTLAAAVETLHLATLIHDDIIDESRLRRGQTTIQAKYSKEYAVYMGDYLFSQCFIMLSNQEISPEILKFIAKGVARICKGEMMQGYLRYNTDINVYDYLRIIKGKTAALFAVSLASGANESGVDKKIVKKLMKIGLNIGMAFQLIDDLLDYTGDLENIGKEVQTDILRGYYSLPLILALNSSAKASVKAILDLSTLNESSISDIIQITNECGAIKETEKLAKRYTDKALQYLNELPKCSGKNILMDIIPKMLNRSY